MTWVNELVALRSDDTEVYVFGKNHVEISGIYQGLKINQLSKIERDIAVWQSPITRDLAKIGIIEFVPKVAKAIKALHAIGIAHLDIRFCFRDGDAVLIRPRPVLQSD